MRLATLRAGGRDGTLVVVDGRRERWAAPEGIATLQAALDDWEAAAPALEATATALEADPGAGWSVNAEEFHAPLPRAYQWAEGSTYLSHMRRCRAARGVAMPPDAEASPTIYQSGSDVFLAPRAPIGLGDPEWGLDLEATVAVVVDDVPQGTDAEAALAHIRLVVLVNDLTLRNVLPREFATAVGLYQCKPARPVAPIAVTPASLGEAWVGDRLRARVRCTVNGERLGDLDSGADCRFGFGVLIAHMAVTRPLAAGTLVGSGTVSNLDETRGTGCIIERRALQALAGEEPLMPYLQDGDTVEVEALDARGRSLFGAISQTVRAAT